MINQINALDPNSFAGIKRLAHENSPEGNKAAAQQFEAMFMQVMLKSMRDTVQQDGMFDSDTTRAYQSMYDQQLAQVLAQRGGLGLAAVIERQLNGTALLQPPSYDLKGPLPGVATDSPVKRASDNPVQATAAAPALGAQSFVEQMWPQAQDAARELDVPAHFLVGQAALETGWGKSELKRSDGSPSYNLFNIKAGRGWNGAVVEAQTTEYENGVAVTRTERFRAYGSYAESFRDYANLVTQSPRYARAVGQSNAEDFAKGLVAGGYATDPAYAEKLTRVINGNSMRAGLTASAMR